VYQKIITCFVNLFNLILSFSVSLTIIKRVLSANVLIAYIKKDNISQFDSLKCH
jgi:hypothetical protein